MAKKAPLEGIRVLDFTWAWAGPQASLILALLGAEVIKVESRRRLDHSRLRSLVAGPVASPDESFIFNTLNLNKLSVTLNLSEPRAVEIAKALAQISDVVMENMRPGVMDRLGLGYEALRALKSDIIMLSSSAVGGSGPERLYTGYAPTFAAMGGLAYITGRPDGRPAPLMGAIDLRVGSTGAFAVLAALYYHQRTGKGQYIDLSSAEAVSALMGDAFMDYTMNERVQERMGNLDQVMAPHGCYRCRAEREWVTIAVGSEEEWRSLCRVLGDQRLTEDERFADGYSRRQNQDDLDKIIGEWTAGRSAQEVMQSLAERRRGRDARLRRPLTRAGRSGRGARHPNRSRASHDGQEASGRPDVETIEDARRDKAPRAAHRGGQRLRAGPVAGDVAGGDGAAGRRAGHLLEEALPKAPVRCSLPRPDPSRGCQRPNRAASSRPHNGHRSPAGRGRGAAHRAAPTRR